MRIFRALLVTSIAGCLVGAVALPASAKTGDKQAAKDAQLLRADLPDSDTWSLRPRENTDKESDALRKDIFECFQIRRVLKASKQYRVQGPNFTRNASGGGAQQVNDTTYVFPTVKDARSYMSPFLDDNGIDCFRKFLLKQLQKAVPSGTDVLVQSVERAPELGDSSVGYVLTATFTPKTGPKEKAYFDAYAIRVGRGVTGLSMQSQQEPLDGVDTINENATKRLEDAL